MKTLEFDYPMIQFFIKADKPLGMLEEHSKTRKPRAACSTNILRGLLAFIKNWVIV